MRPPVRSLLLAAVLLTFAVFAVFLPTVASAQEEREESAVQNPAVQETQELGETLRHRLDVLQKSIDDNLWFSRLDDVAVVDKVMIYGPPKWKEANPTGIGAGNPVRFYAYLFTPKGDFGTDNLPLLVLTHGGVHGDLTTYYVHIVRELMAQGYIVVAAEYRGSTGYGREFYESIDYGGREVEDVLAARDWAVANHPRVDPKRVGLIGWSHGGMITFLSLVRHPEAYVAGFAGVPVSDLVLRMGYQDQSYRDLYEADYFLGQSAHENLEEYKKRSPVWNVEDLQRPVRIHSNRSDDDVNVIEVEHLIQALKAAGKDFESQIYDLPGGHTFDRLDTPEAWKVRREIYRFLARYLHPPKPDVQLGLNAAGRAAP